MGRQQGDREGVLWVCALLVTIVITILMFTTCIVIICAWCWFSVCERYADMSTGAGFTTSLRLTKAGLLLIVDEKFLRRFHDGFVRLTSPYELTKLMPTNLLAQER